jgi:hypothetical protein
MRHSGEYVAYVKGFRHFLLFVHGAMMTAIDATPQSERVLWSKTFSSVLVCQQNSAKVTNTQRPTPGVMFPRNSVFVSPRGIYCWESNRVSCLDPLTGQTLWERKIPYENCTILGDDDNLFLVFPDIRHVVAVDPESGRELESGPMPPDAVYVYGTNIVTMQKRGNDDALYLCDLRDIHDKQRRALLTADSPELTLAPPIPRNLLHDKLTTSSMVQPFRNDRFLTVATWSTKSLQIYDLQTKKKLFPENNTLLDFVSEDNVKTTRCDVEFIGDRILVLFTKDTNYRQPTENEPDPENKNRMLRLSYTSLPSAVGSAIGEGQMMLFDSEGKSCWLEPTKIENSFRLADVSDRLPVMLFAVQCVEYDIAENKRYSTTRIIALDKRTGETRLRKRFYHSEIPLQTFRVNANLETQEIMFTTINVPPRTIRAFFPAGE